MGKILKSKVSLSLDNLRSQIGELCCTRADVRYDPPLMLHPVHMRYKDGDYDDDNYPLIRRPKDEEPKMTAEEEYLFVEDQVEKYKGFDIYFSKLRCAFNYRPLNLDDVDLFGGTETTIEFMDRMARGSLERFNELNSTKYEYVKVVKVNYHFAAGLMFYITFEGKLPSDDDSKEFQARLCYCDGIADFISCELKPQKKVHSTEAPEKEDPKKPRLTQEPSSNV